MNFADHWIDRYFALFRANYPAAGAAAALFFFIIGLLIASAIHFSGIYLRTIPIYLCVFGIGWWTAWTGWCRPQVPRLIESIRPAFALTDDEFAAIAQRWRSKIFDAPFQLLVGAILTVVIWAAIVVSTYRHFNPWLPAEWLEPQSLGVKAAILCLYSVPVGVLLAACAVAMLAYCSFVIDLGRRPLLPNIAFVKFALRPIADFAIPCWFAWTVGVALFVLFFRVGFNAVNIVVVLVLTAIGLIMLLVPQYALYRALKETREAIVSRGWKELLASGYDVENPAHMATDPNWLRMHDFLQSVADTKAWPNDRSDALLVLGTWLIPIATLAVQSTLLRPAAP